jgi:hypothetical protein
MYLHRNRSRGYLKPVSLIEVVYVLEVIWILSQYVVMSP